MAFRKWERLINGFYRQPLVKKTSKNRDKLCGKLQDAYINCELNFNEFDDLSSVLYSKILLK